MNAHIYAIIDRKGVPVYIGHTIRKQGLRKFLKNSYRTRHRKIRKFLNDRTYNRIIWLGEVELYDGNLLAEYITHCLQPQLNITDDNK